MRLALLTCLFVPLLPAACGDVAPTPVAPGITASPTTAAPASASLAVTAARGAMAAYPFTVMDSVGQTVTFAQTPCGGMR